jgi:hypothetical protein
MSATRVMCFDFGCEGNRRLSEFEGVCCGLSGSD